MSTSSKPNSALKSRVQQFLDADNLHSIVEITDSIASQKLTAFSHLFVFPECRDITLGQAGDWHKNKFKENAKECPPLCLIDVVLSINREYRTKVEPVMIALNEEKKSGTSSLSFLKNNTFESLEKDLQRLLPEFYRAYCDSNGKYTFNDMEKNIIRNELRFVEVNDKKMRIILDMLKAIRKLKQDVRSTDDYEVMHHWAVQHCVADTYFKKNGQPDLKKLAQSLGGKIENVGDATIQHLRMHFGAEVFKPDQRVKEVLINKYLDIALDDKLFNAGLLTNQQAYRMMEKIKNATHKPLTWLDSVFVNYGSGYYTRKEQELGYTKMLLQIILKRLSERKVSISDLVYATGLPEEKVLEMIGPKPP